MASEPLSRPVEHDKNRENIWYPMKIISAKTAGFCMGVRRAVDLSLEQAAHSDGIYTIGPLIHNSQTLEMLRQRGVEELDDSTPPESTSKLLIRAHGIPPQLQERYRSAGHEIIDGTCPKVKTVHKVIERYRRQEYRIIITGDAGHPEVIGLLGYAGENGVLIDSVAQVAALPDGDKVCLVSQTTFDRLLFDAIADAVKERYRDAQDVVVKKTICSATDLRQTEVALLASQVDALIVVGGKNSANTQRLAKIAAESGTPTQLVETEQEIDWNRIANCRTVGVTAGASTPNWMIKRVNDYLHFMDQTRKRGIHNLIWHGLDICANLNIFVALGAVSLLYASSFLLGLPFTAGGAAMAFLYFLSMYLWNSLGSIESMEHHGISRYRFYQVYRRQLWIVSGASILVLLFLSFMIKRELGVLMLFASVAGSAYHMTFMPRFLRAFFRYKNLKDIPTSRDLFVALAWATVLTLIPHLINGGAIMFPVAPATFCWIFILAFLRSLIFDLRDIEGDRIMGRETLITIFGEKRARKALQILVVSCFFGLLLFPALMGISAYRKQNTIQFLFQIPVLLYIFAFVKVNPYIRKNRNALFNLLADGLFYLAGVGAYLASLIIA
ncbi:MAG: 4-hydroxy-3-methylbut-2-enyl diphosphate reductase [Chitinispirillaceae bacterium]|nr:4-hydroxy-3-methylbut-2-enyl diphosphate reductase [Chitinispirillaceae bacterium]